MRLTRSSPLVVVSVGLVVLAVLCGCSAAPDAGRAQPPPPADAVEERRTVEVAGEDRSYLLYVPAALPADEPPPVVLFLHGGVGSGEQLADTADVREHAEHDGYVAVLPDGSTNEQGRFRTWNAGRCCGPAAEQDVDDVAFLGAVLDEVEADLGADPDRLFVAGHSNGAMMANRLACERRGRVAAIAVVAGSLEVPCDDAAPTSVLYLHGDADTNHPLEGGVGEDSVAGVAFTSVQDSVERWVQVDGCATGPHVTRDGDVTTSTWSDCLEQTAVELQVLHGAAHPWPGGERTSFRSDEPSGAIDATEAVWDFFEQHPRG